MPVPNRLLRRPRPWARRVAGGALLALHGALVLSPLVEPRSDGRGTAHVEQDGTRHVNVHNESTCALCSARTQTSMPAPGAAPLASARPRIRAACLTYAARLRDDTPTNLSRAPPLLPA
ncbi:MAG TPA: hypothetical protein VJL28_08910 [Gemmatimonadaceae bacterium]|nr:hypothetical protein [Gemmatimonadaceae bacterium]